MKRTWQPKKLKRMRKHGFLTLMKTQDGRNIIKRRRAQGRSNLTVSDKMRKMMKKPKDTLR